MHPSKVLKGEKFASRYKKDCDIVKVIRSSVPDTGMPSFSKQQLSDAEVKDIIAYIRSLTVPAPPAPVGPKGPKSSSQVGAKTSSSFKNQHP